MVPVRMHSEGQDTTADDTGIIIEFSVSHRRVYGDLLAITTPTDTSGEAKARKLDCQDLFGIYTGNPKSEARLSQVY